MSRNTRKLTHEAVIAVCATMWTAEGSAEKMPTISRKLRKVQVTLDLSCLADGTEVDFIYDFSMYFYP